MSNSATFGKNYYHLLKEKLPQTDRPSTIQTRFRSDEHVNTKPVVSSKQNLQPQKSSGSLLWKLVSLVAVAARGLAVPRPGIAGPPGSQKSGLRFSKQLEPFLAVAPIPPVRNYHRRPHNLSLPCRQWGSTSTWSWHIWSCLPFLTLNSYKL